ncbi:NUDIX domain-containing protein [Nonomuraea pusilla]|uniref:8-oxo-dGTP diphosphatase n=1 Tax=Nonomuraea pusilla TaxID=46177 RepID=A0A1H8K3A6_9ACTN|nr:NUDIX domain-containing protein [Nonomuraea pusilla]SEN87147.1 8-oxo-dGTP diphosphatase [Nonomuraea pusilla]
MTDVEALLDAAAADGISKLVVGAVVHAHGKVLILRRSTSDDFLPGIEELPSGGPDPGEDLMAALARELAEEIGWTGQMSVDPGFVATFDYVSGSGRRARQITFSLAYDGPITLSNEHTSYRWVRPDQTGGTDLTPESVRTIQAWAESRS